ncbi:hypothetical protein SOP89_15960 [Pseudomonas siliginis]|uniref:hypothetical protein n=1 Tax=Pseudomonas siliginis TaxID=2842346 RepID=UPI002B248AFD|nr:hypothetical protein [Pseudomonas siliginis]MEB2652868.1 hypothetical protein [Pseudomonas siliginis]
MTMKSNWISAVALCGWFMAGQAWADCTPPAVSAEADFSLCKEWPAYPSLTITALSTFVPDPVYGHDGSVGSYELDLAIITAGSPKPLATYHQPSAFLSDAIALESLELDTARYKLTPDLRAFGVRAHFKGSSRVNPLDETLLSLYVKEGDKLRPVLDRLVVYSFSGEWDGNCAGERSETVRTLEMGKTSSLGYADIIVRSVTTGLVGEGPPDTCESKTTHEKPVLTTLRYDGQQYFVPENLRGY